MAQQFTGVTSLQTVIDRAVDAFLIKMRETPGFTQALAAAEQSQRTLWGVGEIDPEH